MAARLDGTLSVDLATLTDNDASDGDECKRRNDFHHGNSGPSGSEHDQVFSQSSNLAFKTDSSSGLLETAGLLTPQNYDSNKSMHTSLTNNGSPNLQSTQSGRTTTARTDGLQSGGLENQTGNSNSSTAGTPRRPSYTSKAPSALNTLPGITISEYSPVRSNFDDTAHTQSLNQINNPVNSRKHSLHSLGGHPLHHSNKDPCILPSQPSFDESLDGYSNPGTPSSVKTDSPDAPSPGGAGSQIGHKRSHDVRERNRVSFKTRWDDAAKSDVLPVKCRDTSGELHKTKLGSGSKGKCIKVDDHWFTPTEFEQSSGRGACKDWKRSIRYAGQTLHRLIDDGIITPHAVSCTCAICYGEEIVPNRSSSNPKGGPVKLFVPYTKVKRKRRDGESISKRLSTSGEEALKDLHRGRSFSMDSEVFPTLVHSGHLNSSVLDHDGNMPPMTPVTPLTPLTPITPFTPMTPLTPNALRSGSPPKHSGYGGLNLGLPGMTVASSSAMASAILRPPATPTRSQTLSDIPMTSSHWIQLEEAVTSLLSIGQQLKFLIEQAKIQSEASKDTAVTQAKIQAENEKRDAINSLRAQSIAQITQAYAAAQAEKTDSQFNLTIVKTCQNCGRDALLECTGCHRVYYCSQFCQRKDWSYHQKVCVEHQMMNENPNKIDGKTD